jgi:protein involved in polysaccharide export with SLBB domain
MQRPTFINARLALLSVLFGVTIVAIARAAELPQPTPEQLEAFSQLSPEQQQRLMAELQSGGAGAPGVPSGAALPAAGPTNNGLTPGSGRGGQPSATETDPYYSPMGSGDAGGAGGPAGETSWGYPEDPWLTGDPDFYSEPYPEYEFSGQSPERGRYPDGRTNQNPRMSQDPRTGRLPPTNPGALPSENADIPPKDVERAQLERDLQMNRRDPETGLAYFGYEVFAGAPSTFAPVTDIPAPTDYVMAPGDSISIQLYGKEPGRYNLAVNRDGAVNFPQLGPIVVAGLSFDEARDLLQARVAEQMIGTEASITLGQLRSIRVFVLGEVKQPGSFTVSSLSTVTNALLASGGVSTRGSLRTVQLKRAGNLVTTLDLYDLLLRGDNSADVRLQPGDVIFIPPVGARVGISGQVLRPAMYELKGETTAGDLAMLAGGYTPSAYLEGARIARVDAYRERIQLDVDLKQTTGQGTRLAARDVLIVPSVLNRVDNVVGLTGHVLRPGPRQYRAGMRLTDLIESAAALKPMPDMSYVLIRREVGPDRRVVALSADLGAALREPGSAEDLVIEPRDQVRIFAIDGQRPGLDRLLNELRQQATIDTGEPVVRIDGRVRAPGDYPLEPGMRLSDLLRAGGTLDEAAYAGDAEVTRYDVINGEFRQVGITNVNLSAVRRGDALADIALQPYDFLNVREVTDWREQETVMLLGEVKFPGSYPIRKGETLLSVLERAGGLTREAYSSGAVFTRERLREQEQAQLNQLIDRMESDVASLQLQKSALDPEQAGNAILAGNAMLQQLRSATPVGRLAMDLDRLLTADPGSEEDLVLEANDQLIIPSIMQSVTILGEVQAPASLLFERGLSIKDYLERSGGPTLRADTKRVYVVRANGQVMPPPSRLTSWFSRQTNGELRPGDTIVVPANLDPIRPIPLWTSVSTIIYNLAVGAAAVNSF